MTAIDELFRNLRAQNKKAFMPFITAGDPSLEFTGKVLSRLASLGCSMAELGIPYSDPIADGPVIQASYTRALRNKIRLADIFRMASDLTASPAKPLVAMPMVSMVSYAIVYRHGLERYVDEAKAAGFSGAIVPRSIERIKAV